ncbi:glycosyltransferase [Paenarthrobacter ilicis]|uniref:glycosyltransferase n=1 Tax=Paenarthrobacter ilicis TaxID=43665 RepID=UPI0028D61A61|nr:glycosyltransferase [Paenarthrobacter ilicis]
MKLNLNGYSHTDASPIREALGYIRYLEATNGEKPLLMAYTPVARMNPYQALTYKSFARNNISTIPLIKPLFFDQLTQLKPQVADVLLHLHWNSFVLGAAADRDDAIKRLSSFKNRLLSFKNEGGKVMWTVHNILPHDATHLDLEIDLQQFIADQSDIIHTMSHHTSKAVEDVLSLDESKLLMSPHPSYLGAYEDYVARDEARITLGLDPDEVVYVILGAIKGYKGIQEFIDGFDAACEGSSLRRRLIIAGEPDDSDEISKLVTRCNLHPNILIDARKIPYNLVQLYLRSADILAVPYQRALNSGSAMLGPSFELPVISSRAGSLPEVLQPGFTEFIDGPGLSEMSSAITRADRLLSAEVRAAAAAFARDLQPAPVSEKFAIGIKERLVSLNSNGADLEPSQEMRKPHGVGFAELNAVKGS